MELNVLLVEDYPHPREKVWRALIEPDALGVWLMANDFEPRIGKRFILRGQRIAEGWRGWVECEVLELEPPQRMVWAWTSNEGDSSTRVEFQLEEIAGEAEVTVPEKSLIFFGGRCDKFAGFEGKLDEAAIFNRALTAEEIGKHFAAAQKN